MYAKKPYVTKVNEIIIHTCFSIDINVKSIYIARSISGNHG